MSKDAISDYSATAGSNTDIGGVDINEGCSPSGINNAIRELMSHLADLNAGSSSLGTIKVDNIQIDANAITSTDSNGNISITPNGTGNVVFAEGDIMIGSTALSATAAELNAANNYVHPNHSGEVTSTADGATVIADNIVDEANLKVSNAPVNGYMLTAQSGDTGGLTWAEAPSGFTLASALSGTSPTIDWSSATAFSHTLSGDTTYSFSNVPTGGAIELYLKNVGEQHDILTPVAATGFDVSASSDIGTDTQINNIIFNADGTKMYVTRKTSPYLISQFTLSTAYAINTASFDSGKVSPELDTSHHTLGNQSFNADGTKLFLSYGADVVEHALTSAYDISSLATASTNSVSFTSLFQTGGYSGTPGLLANRMIWADSGSSLILIGTNHGGRSSSGDQAPLAIKISLSSAYDITSTLAHVSSFDPDIFIDLPNDAFVMDVSDDGFHIIIQNKTISSGTTRYRFLLSSPFAFDTATFVGSSNYILNNSSATSINGIRIADNQFVVTIEYQSSSALNSDLYNYDINKNYEITFPAATSTQPLNIGIGHDSSTTTYLRMVSLDGTNSLITDHREITA